MKKKEIMKKKKNTYKNGKFIGGAGKWLGKTCASLFSVYTTCGHHFPLKFPQFLRKIKVRQRPPGQLPWVRAGRGRMASN